ncbi:hypothetical protein OOZ63_23910 [Paucibacter sp. PLA-PC-4]|uniref:hypothetical protein n=1 Tax=Paucibacter sp. PLA-PC-4 TaxID=2993655 RepID=UPI00224AA47A|nr:hypothetical protein [Paucibacter sp. PLA-PC-4]MCX2864880.1 hypothetical protein [Paucibacter sp. PLA-PC-4]
MTRFLHALALRERSLLPVLQPRLPGPFERPESPVEPGWRAVDPGMAPATDFQAPVVTVAGEPLPLPIVQRRPAPATPPAPAQVATPLEPAHADAASASTGHHTAFVPAAEPASSPAGPAVVEQQHRPAAPEVQCHAAAGQRVGLMPPVDTVAVVPQPVAVPLVNDVPPVHRPALAQPALLPRWTPQAEPAPRRGHVGASRRADPVDEQRSDPPPARLAIQTLAPRAAQVPPAADRPAETRPPAPPAQGSLVDAEPRRLLVPALVQQVQASPPRAEGRDAAALAAGPTVHVSIGRVEVRAAAPAAAPLPATRVKAPVRPPALSLNDYLLQRGAAPRRSSGGTGGAR